MHPVLLPTDAVIADPDIQPRVELDEAFAEEYAQDVKAGKNFPPVKVFFDGEKYLLADGFHRLRAHVLAGQKFIRAEVCSGTNRDAILYSGVAMPHTAFVERATTKRGRSPCSL